MFYCTCEKQILPSKFCQSFNICVFIFFLTLILICHQKSELVLVFFFKKNDKKETLMKFSQSKMHEFFALLI